MSSNSSDEVQEVEAEKPDELGESGGVTSLTPSDESTATPPPPGGHSLLDSGTPAQEASQYYNNSTDSHNASEVPWLQTVGSTWLTMPKIFHAYCKPTIPADDAQFCWLTSLLLRNVLCR